MDDAFRQQLLRALVRDRKFLKSVQGIDSDAVFAEPEEVIIAAAALEFWEKYQQPIGAMLRTRVADAVKKKPLNANAKQRLAKLFDLIQQQKMEVVATQALVAPRAAGRDLLYQKVESIRSLPPTRKPARCTFVLPNHRRSPHAGYTATGTMP